MKNILLIFAVAFSFHCYSQQAIPQPAPKAEVKLKTLDDAEAGFIAKQMMDSSMRMGTFEAAGIKSRVRTFKNKVLPEIENNYLDVVISNRLTKMNSLQIFRGVFDSMIFVQLPTFSTDAEEPMQFYPYPDTKWLLFLKSPYKADGTPSENWVRGIEKLKADKFLNSKTVFAVANEYHGSEILEWNYDYPTALNSYSINTGFIKEIGKLLEMLQAAKIAKRQSNPPVSLSSQSWENDGIKKVALKLDGLLSIKPAKEEEENTKGQ
jgi:hypothetical protein